MVLLSFESSAAPASVCLCRDGERIAESFQRTGLTHSATLMPMAEDLLKNADFDVSEVEGVAVAAGPGSFTGIRIGLAAAKGLAWSLNVPVAPVSTLEAMAWMFEGLETGTVCAVMDARRQQVYRALFDLSSGKPVRLAGDDAVSVQELGEELKKVEGRKVFVGDGALLCYNKLNESIGGCLAAPPHLLYQTAWGVARCAMEHEDIWCDAADARAEYHRLPQAERERLAREQEKGEISDGEQ